MPTETNDQSISFTTADISPEVLRAIEKMGIRDMEGVFHRLCIQNNLLLIGFEIRLQRFVKAHSLGRDHMLSTTGR